MLQRVVRIAAFATMQLVVCGAVQARDLSREEALQTLSRAIQATNKLNYDGVFVYRHGDVSETTRIIHFIESGKEYEHLEVLNGSPREVLREGEEVRCYMPESHTIFVEMRGERHTFSSILPASLSSIAEHYAVHEGAPMRVAGFDTQSIVLEPRDDYRYAYQFWVDKASGMLLKAGMSTTRRQGDTPERELESFSFTELKLDVPPDLSRMRVRLQTNEDWQVHHVETRDSARIDDSSWVFRNVPPGFRRTAAMRRQSRLSAPAGLHFIYSDGLAAISVFIEPNAGGKSDKQVANLGAINAYRRVVGGYQILVMGEAPAAAVKRLADGIEWRKKH
ncbi:MAG TPA: MucB/RseB C-terminal domain-containing protein [Rhodocyclaceae bacterium]|jgi:sigma-E factor negative regulatory protein RseB|nr:MucB/RseB C-terminal domain-containing protein [Rhodocyclaceae bacterium]